MAPLTWLWLVLGAPRSLFPWSPVGSRRPWRSEGSLARGRRWTHKTLEVQPWNRHDHDTCHVLVCKESHVAKGQEDRPPLWEGGVPVPRAWVPAWGEFVAIFCNHRLYHWDFAGLTYKGWNQGQKQPKITRVNLPSETPEVACDVQELRATEAVSL